MRQQQLPLWLLQERALKSGVGVWLVPENPRLTHRAIVAARHQVQQHQELLSNQVAQTQKSLNHRHQNDKPTPSP